MTGSPGSPGPTPSHPILEDALRCLKKRKDGKIDLLPKQVAALRKKLAGLAKSPEIAEVIRELVTFAYYLETERGSPKAARGFLDVASGSIAALKSGMGRRPAARNPHRKPLVDLGSGDRAARPLTKPPDKPSR